MHAHASINQPFQVRDETEVREREVRRLGGELKKATEARDEAVAAAKAEVIHCCVYLLVSLFVGWHILH